MKTLAATLALLLLTSSLSAQLTMPRASPRVQMIQDVGLGQVVLDYSRPGVKGRTIFGDLEPYGVVWRTGADASSKIGFDRDVTFGGEDVPAGTYAIYTIPEADSWTVILHRNTELWGAGGYDPADDLLRVEVPVTRLESTWESLTIDFRGFHMNGAELFIRWGHCEVSVPVTVDSEAAVLEQIDERITKARGPVSANTYYDAAKFYAETGRDLSVAAGWVEAAVELSPGAFWMVYYRAELAQTQGDLEAARAWATRAHEMASQAADDYGYVARSQELIEALDSAASGG